MFNRKNLFRVGASVLGVIAYTKLRNSFEGNINPKGIIPHGFHRFGMKGKPIQNHRNSETASKTQIKNQMSQLQEDMTKVTETLNLFKDKIDSIDNNQR